MKFDSPAREWTALLVGVVCISVSAILVKQAGVPGLSSAFYRVFIAAVVLLPFFLRRGRQRISKRNLALAVLGGVFFGIELAFWNLSIIISNATFPTLLVNLSIIWVAIGATLLLGERLGLNHWAGNLLALAGVAVLLIGLDKVFNLQIGTNFIYAIAASVFLAGYILLIKSARREAATLPVIFYALLGSTATLFVICTINAAPLGGFSARSWLCLLGLGLITQLGGYFSINFALGYLDSTKVSLVTLLQPVLTAIFSAILLGERFDTKHFVGGAMVLSGLALALVRPLFKTSVSIENSEKAKRQS